MDQQTITISQPEVLQALNRSEIDMQIATAKAYPRDIQKSLNNIRALATMDEETSESCFYAVKRGKGDDAKMVEGLSVRMAEIFASSWGNLRVQTQIIGNDNKTVTARGVCHDLENNLAISVEVKRRITDKYGHTYSEDMQVVTGNAASAIAFRNAIFKVIPMALTKKVVNDIKQIAIGKANDLPRKRQSAIDWFNKAGVSLAEILEYLEVAKVEEIDAEKVLTLHSTANAIKEGTTTIDETFHSHKTASNEYAEKVKESAKQAPVQPQPIHKVEEKQNK